MAVQVPRSNPSAASPLVVVSPPAATASGSAPAQGDATAPLRHLLRIEAEIRACGSIEELGILLVNEVRKMTSARQVYFIDLKSGSPRLEAVSGSRELDRNAPAMRWLALELGPHGLAQGWDKPFPLVLKAGVDAVDEEGRAFPFPHGHWLPIQATTSGFVGGLLLVGEQPFQEGPVAIGERLAATAAHAAIVLDRRAARQRAKPHIRLLLGAMSILALVALGWPTPMTALAPMEVVPTDAFVVAAPIDGVIEDIAVAPNAPVAAGDIVVRYVDTVPRNQLYVAEREVNVAEAKLRQLQQTAFVDERAKRELAQARSELALKSAERDFARDTLERSQVRAPRDGLAIYADRKEWVGKAVSTGQRILEIADVRKVRLRAQLPVAEVLDLQPGARIRVFLDGDPLRPIDATVTSMSHQARVSEGQGLAYRIEGEFAPGVPPPRLGVRGTAQLFSERVPLVYYLFRRPLIWLRQKVGL